MSNPPNYHRKTMPPSASRFLSLPDDILVEILGHVGASSLVSLANISLVCRSLHDLVEDDGQAVWHAIHGALYDDPTRASAFLTARTGFNWRQRVVDRYFTQRFLQIWDNILFDDPEFGPGIDFPPEAHSQAQRVFQTVLDLYLDLPALGVPSANAPLLERIVGSRCFVHLCAKTGYNNPTCKRIEALLGHLESFNRNRRLYDPVCNQGAVSYFMYSPAAEPRFETDHNPKQFDDPDKNAQKDAGDNTPWLVLGIAAGLFHRNIRSLCPELPLEQTMIDRGVDTVRGPGLLGLRHPTCAELDPWDWAGVQGQWCGRHAWFLQDVLLQDDYFRRLGSFGDFTVTPARDRAHVASQALDHGLDADLWKQLPNLDIDQYNDSLPPLYWYGYIQYILGPPGFIFGFVHLTNESPPQIKWTLGANVNNRPALSFVSTAYQLGVCGSSKGIAGVSPLFHTWGRAKLEDMPLWE